MPPLRIDINLRKFYSLGEAINWWAEADPEVYGFYLASDGETIIARHPLNGEFQAGWLADVTVPIVPKATPQSAAETLFKGADNQRSTFLPGLFGVDLPKDWKVWALLALGAVLLLSSRE